MPDLGAIKPAERRVELTYPGNPQKKCGLWVTIISLDDERLKKLRRSYQDDANRAAQRGKIINAEDQDEKLNRLIIAAMTGWGWEKDDDGEEAVFNGGKPEFKEAKIREVFAQSGWVRDQLSEALGDTSSFFAN